MTAARSGRGRHEGRPRQPAAHRLSADGERAVPMASKNQPVHADSAPAAARRAAAVRKPVARLAEMLNDRIADLAQELLGQPNQERSSVRQLRFGSKGSVAVEITGENAGCWYDHEAGSGGAGLELIRHRLGVDEHAAREWAHDWLGEPPSGSSSTGKTAAPGSTTLKGPSAQMRAAKVVDIVRRAESPVATPAQVYLCSRGITVEPPDCIRYRRLAYSGYGAMVALATDVAGEVLATQQVYLTPEGGKAPVDVVKRTNKAVDRWAERAAVRLPGRKPLVLCEGVETALSIWQATGQETWACLGIANISRVPVPDSVTVIIARDGDAPGSPADGLIVRAAASLTQRGIKVMIATPPKNQDLNDVLMREGEGAVRNCISRAEIFPSVPAESGRKRLCLGSDVEVAKRVLDDLISLHGRILHSEGAFWRYGRTNWAVIPDHEMRLVVHTYDGAVFKTPAGERSTVRLSRNRINSVLNESAALCTVPEAFHNPAAGINCASGFIRFGADGTPRLEAHHPEHRCRHTLPGRWQPGASGTPPADSLMARLLTGSFRDDPDAEAKCALLAEVCGAAASGHATRLMQPRAVILHGQTAENGKSQVLDLARGLLPTSAICSVAPSKMADERHVIGLAGKLLNASDELSPGSITSNTFKAVVTGEQIAGRDVFKTRIEFSSMAQNVFATNHLPSLKDVDRGLQRRLLVIPFNRSIPLEERIENIGTRIAAEEPDLLLAWAVDGAARLIRQRNFAIPDSCRKALSEWLQNEDPVLAWIEACVEARPIVNSSSLVATGDAYRHFTNWALGQGFRSEKIPAKNGFVQRVQAQQIPHKRTSKGRVFGLVMTDD